MKKQALLIFAILMIVCILSSGCILKKDLGSLSDSGSNIEVSTVKPAGEITQTEKNSHADPISKPVMTTKPSGSTQLKEFIEGTFPELTTAYMDIRAANSALDESGIQEKSLALETLVKELIDDYNLDNSLPEKNVFPGLTTKEKVIFNNYIGFIKDIGYYASSLKQAIYWKKSGTDSVSLGNYRRNQDLADQYEKKLITDIKTLDGYCKEWDFPYIDKKYVQEYSFIS